MASAAGRRKISSFLASQKLAVIATNSPEGKAPESALVAFVDDENLCLYFQTSSHARKAANLEKNTWVSAVIGLDINTMATLQYEGTATRLRDPGDIASCKQRFLDKDSPTTAEYLERPGAIFFKVTPSWISLSDYSAKQPVVIELSKF